MGLLNNLKLRTKFIVILFLPLAGLVWFGAMGVWDKHAISSEMSVLEELSGLAVRISALIHETQKERGMTAGYLGSKGKSFGTEIVGQRRLVDQRADALRRYLKNMDTARFGAKFSAILADAMERLDGVNGIRSRVDSLGIPVKKAISYYTKMNASFLDLVAEISKLSTNPEITIISVGYHNFLMGKERAGIERAVLSNTFARNRFLPGMFGRFSALVAAQDTYFSVFQLVAPPDEVAFYKQKMSDPVVAEVQKMRDVALEKGAASYKTELLTGIYENIGYGGAIHLFKNYVLRSQPKYAKGFEARYQKIISLINQFENLPDVKPEEKRLLEIVRSTIDKYRAALAVIVKMKSEGKSIKEIDATVKVDDGPALNALQALAEVAKPGNFGIKASVWFATITKKINLLKEVEDKISSDLKSRAEDLKTKANLAFWGYLIVTLLVVFISIGLGILVARRILGQLGGEPEEVMAVARRVADGDLSMSLDAKRPEHSIYGAIRHMVDNLSQTVKKVTETAFTVAASAAEISQGNQDLSDRTQQQAAAIEETASALEEMTGSVKQNAANSQQANELATKTAAMAQNGGEVLERTERAMAAVTESSKKISDIINVVNEIAFQTNLLALNAAVEAARAGEAGRGFAVVAGEVRNLAGRSASAAKEIQALISDSVEKVEQGNQSVAESARLLGEIIENVQAVADTISEINAASQEQAQGIEEVNKAVAQMDQAVQQNAALVEEAASASETMANAARELRQRMEGFKLNGLTSSAGAPAAAPAPPAPPASLPAPAPAASSRPRPTHTASADDDDFFGSGGDDLEGFEEF